VSEIVLALKGYRHMDRSSFGRVDLRRGLEDTLVILRSQLTGVEVRREFAPDLPSVDGNAGELNQVWTNLIANAADALNGSGTLTLRLAPARGSVRVEVEDDGPGIPGDLIERVFDPFMTTKPPGEGTGLGLNLAHRTVTDAHGGTITVASRPGCTRFVVTLPIERGAPDG
jgi:signal transduction histidine kinase